MSVREGSGSYRTAAVIRQLPGAILYQALDASGRPVILKVLGPRRPRPREIDRLQNEYRVAAHLAIPAVVRALALDQHQDAPALVLEDTGGTSLDQLLGEPLEVGRFLRLAAAAAAALAQVHQRGVVHKDIKPENLIVNELTGEVKLTDFGIATLLSAEERPPASPAVIEGTLAYMSPEQTGRMNRTLDQRSDLYSLGMTFYEMLTGALPFAPDDPLEWVHCHIARHPPPPARVTPGVPQILSDLVQRLLAKEPDDRYQSAAGLKYDLEICRARWEREGKIDPFGLGERDVPDRLKIPHKLYGREVELSVLTWAFQRALLDEPAELVVVRGPAGAGKSRLVQELAGPIVKEWAVLLAGRFGPADPNVPYVTLIEAMREQVRDILAQPDERVVAWGHRLRQALGAQAPLVVEVIPELQLIIGPARPPAAANAPAAAQAHFTQALARVVRAFGARGRPVVLFLDDLQGVDPVTLGLVEQMITDPDATGLLVVMAYRDDEVGAAHPLAQTIDRIRQAGRAVREVDLPSLPLSEVRKLSAAALAAHPEVVDPLARLVHEKTAGNPFFVVQLLTELHAEGLIRLDHQARMWRWDLERIAARSYTSNVAVFMAARTRRLPEATQRLLALAALIQSPVDVALLAPLLGRPPEEVEGALSACVDEGLLVRQGGLYRFSHDRVRETARQLDPPAARAATHLEIARLLARRTLQSGVDDLVFEIVAHFDAAADCITDADERERAAAFCLTAARRARASHAYHRAAQFLATGNALLGPARQQAADLAFRIDLERADCLFRSGALELALSLLGDLLGRARTDLDRAAVYRIRLVARVAAGQIPGAVEDERAGLAVCGLLLPEHPAAEDVGREMAEVRRLLDQLGDDDLVDLPTLVDPVKLAATTFETPAFFVDPQLFVLHVARLVRLTLEHGLSDSAPYFLGNLALALVGAGDYLAARRLAEAANAIIDCGRVRGHKQTAKFCLGVTAFWTDPLDRAIAHLGEGFEIAAQTGEPSAAGYCAAVAVVARLARGDGLEEVWQQAQVWLAFCRKVEARDGADAISAASQLIRCLQGQTRDLLTFDDGDFDQAGFEAGLTPERTSTVVCWYWIFRLRASFLAGDHQQALAAAERARPLLFAAAAFPPHRDYVVYHALTLAARMDRASASEQTAAQERLAQHEAQLRRWAELNPSTFRGALALVAAERARVEGRLADAARGYQEALPRHGDAPMVHEEALVHELSARFYRDLGATAVANLCLQEARAAYERWGARGKATQLARRAPGPATHPPDPGWTLAAAPGELDLRAVVEASQALSGEVVVDRLLERLMKLVLTASGGQRACVVLLRQGVLSLEATAVVDAAGTRVETLLGRRLPSTPPPLPMSVVHYVLRTNDRVVLDDARQEGRYADDPYLVLMRPRSLLCLPVRRGGEAVGLLYLDNAELGGAFTAERLAVLEILAAQAAISLENARLLAREQEARAAAEASGRQAKLVAEATAVLYETLSDQVVLRRLTRLLVESLGQWCAIDLLREGEIVPAGQAHADASKELLLGELRRRYPPTWDSPQLAAEVIRTGQPLLWPELTPESLRRYLHDDQHLRLCLELGASSGLAVPMTARGRLVGAISLFSGRPDGRFGAADLELLQEIARRAAIAIDNAQLYRRAEEAIQVRDEFLTIASHELKTPMTTMMLNLQAMSSPESNNPVMLKGMALRAERQGRRLAALVQELLDVSRLDRGAAPLLLSQVDLGRLVSEAAARLEPQLQRARCALSLDAAPGIVGPWDAQRLEQVLGNLLSNACKFGPGKPLEVRVWRAGETARFSVTDQGIGIEPAAQARIFERFVRAVPATNYGGLGLGLYICRRIVQAHGGSIMVQSQPGQGATFTVELPMPPGT